MKRSLLLFLTCLLAASGCGVIRGLKAVKHLGKAELDTTDYLTEIPFELKAGHILLKVRINKKEERDFFFDTGAPTAISPDLRRDMDLPFMNAGQKDDSTSIILPTVAEIQLSDLIYTDVGAVEVDTKEMFARSCSVIDGLVGNNMMSKGIWQIDYEKNKLVVTDHINKLDHVEGAIMLPFETSSISKSPVLDVQLDNGRHVRLVVDTGSNSGITFNTPDNNEFVSSFHSDSLSEFYTKGYTSILGKEVADQQNTAYIISSQLRFADVNMPSELITYGRYKNFNDNKNGVIGNEFLKSYIVTIDWQTHVLYLYRFKEMKARTGNFGFLYGFDNKKLLVGAVFKDSDVAKAGVAVGDEVTEINGYKVAELTAQQLCDYMNDKFVLLPREKLSARFVLLTRNGKVELDLARK